MLRRHRGLSDLTVIVLIVGTCLIGFLIAVSSSRPSQIRRSQTSPEPSPQPSVPTGQIKDVPVADPDIHAPLPARASRARNPITLDQALHGLELDRIGETSYSETDHAPINTYRSGTFGIVTCGQEDDLSGISVVMSISRDKTKNSGSLIRLIRNTCGEPAVSWIIQNFDSTEQKSTKVNGRELTMYVLRQLVEDSTLLLSISHEELEEAPPAPVKKPTLGIAVKDVLAGFTRGYTIHQPWKDPNGYQARLVSFEQTEVKLDLRGHEDDLRTIILVIPLPDDEDQRWYNLLLATLILKNVTKDSDPVLRWMARNDGLTRTGGSAIQRFGDHVFHLTGIKGQGNWCRRLWIAIDVE